MSEAKPFASLSSTLLARKGQAKPAMRPQGFNPHNAHSIHDDLGWNDMGLSAPYPAVAEAAPDAVQPVPPPVVRQQAEIAQELGAIPEAAVAPAPAPVLPVSRAKPGAKNKAAFTLRLDPDRHLKLRLACAVTHRSAQMIVTQALDAFLHTMPELDAFAESATAGQR